MTSSLIRRERAIVTVTVMLDVAFHVGRNQTASAADIAERVGLARRGMEPVLQSLSRAGLLESVRGPRGGYRLGRAARDIAVVDILAVAASADEPAAEEAPGALQRVVIEPLWAELDDAARERLSALQLSDLIRQAEAAGLRRPTTEPISYVI